MWAQFTLYYPHRETMTDESNSPPVCIDNQEYVNRFYREEMYRHFAVLKLWVNPANRELVELYREHVEKHNQKNDATEFNDSGFDLFVPGKRTFTRPYVSQFLDLEVKAEMVYTDLTITHIQQTEGETDSAEKDRMVGVAGVSYGVGYYMYPRSSISKTPLMLANHTGIIDSGYRGNLLAAVRYLPENPDDVFELAEHTRLFQLCHPQLCPIYVVLVEEHELTKTERGAGGFGSTGLTGAV